MRDNLTNTFFRAKPEFARNSQNDNSLHNKDKRINAQAAPGQHLEIAFIPEKL